MLLKSDTAPMVPLMLGASVPMDEVFADLDSWRLVLFALVTSWPVPNELEDDALECEIQQKNVQLGKKVGLVEGPAIVADVEAVDLLCGSTCISASFGDEISRNAK